MEAYRNGQKGIFSEKSWSLMGENKHGWTLTEQNTNSTLLPPVEVIEFITKKKDEEVKKPGRKKK